MGNSPSGDARILSGETLENHAVEPRIDFHQGLLWYLHGMRPQGFLGRAFARFHGPLLGLPTDPNRWSDDQTLLALANTGHDCPGNLLVESKYV